MKKLIVVFLALILLVGVAQAELNDSVLQRFKLSEGTGDAIDTEGFANIPERGTVDSGAGMITGFNSRGQYTNSNFFARNIPTGTMNMTTSWTVSALVIFGSDPGGNVIIHHFGGQSWILTMAYEGATNRFKFEADGGCAAVKSESISTGVWWWVIGTHNATDGKLRIWVNGTEGTPATCGTDNDNFQNQSIGIHARDSTVISAFDGNISDVIIWNRELLNSEVSAINTSYAEGEDPLFSPLPQTDIDFTVTDSWNGTNINNFTVNISWTNGTNQQKTTTNGTVSLTNVSDSNTTINVTYSSMTDYFNTTILNQIITVNTSNTVAATTYQAILNLFVREIISNNSLSGSTFNIGTKTTAERFNITAATHNVIATHPNYYNLSGSATTTVLNTSNETLEGMYSSIVNVSAYFANGTSLNNFGLNITHNTFTNWSGDFVETTNGTTWFNLINGTYTAVINSSEGNQTFNFVVNGRTENVSFFYFSIDNCGVFTQTMINFTILKESTATLLNDSTLNTWVNVSSSFFIEPLQFNFSFSSGNYYALCIPDNTVSGWTINAQVEYSNLPTYAEKDYWFVDFPLNSSPTNINLYLTNGTTQVKLQIRDFNDDPISDVFIKVLSYDLGTNSFTTTEIIKTDSAGDAYAQIVQDINWYSFILEKDGKIILQTLPTKITTDALTLRVNLDTDYFASYDVVQGITSDLTFNNATTTFTFTWSDPTGSVAQGCLKLIRRTINGETAINTTCVTSSGATILMNISEAPGANTYVADGYVVISGENFALQSLSKSFNNTFKTFGLSGVFFSMLLILTLVMVGLWHPVASIILMVIGVVATNIMGIFYLNWTYIVTFIVLAVITIYRTGKSD